MSENRWPEPWLRGTLTDVLPVQRAVLHALQLAHDNIERLCTGLSDTEFDARPHGLEPLSFHVRHIARSMDRLLTYAEGRQLSDGQIDALKSEMNPGGTKAELFSEFSAAMENAAKRIRAFSVEQLGAARTVGRKKLPTTVTGLLIHVADHTQRHAGQVVTTARVLIGTR